jgi:hypothetical protein
MQSIVSDLKNQIKKLINKLESETLISASQLVDIKKGNRDRIILPLEKILHYLLILLMM